MDMADMKSAITGNVNLRKRVVSLTRSARVFPKMWSAADDPLRNAPVRPIRPISPIGPMPHFDNQL